ncbi:hypothetical protein IEQ34_017692 [Dendrobium chrysotoxum]|uniref:Uncharacterized protein n=1 Tax=Dendrobium chrysotoxum TaxID=161865 RepID=A0AAV7GC57_DENCH|nr:hypothetical protein IEQ34_017692 [Dendrobium chrysotoxum]
MYYLKNRKMPLVVFLFEEKNNVGNGYSPFSHAANARSFHEIDLRRKDFMLFKAVFMAFMTYASQELRDELKHPLVLLRFKEIPELFKRARFIENDFLVSYFRWDVRENIR